MRVAFPIRDLPPQLLEAVGARDEIEVRKFRWRDDLAEHLLSVEHGRQRAGRAESIAGMEPLRHLRLRIEVEQENPEAAGAESSSEVHRDRALAASTLGVDHGDYAHGGNG